MNENAPFQVFTTTNDSGIEEFHFNLLGGIEEPSRYVELFQVLRNADEESKVHLYLNTHGGYIITMLQIVNCMKNTRATVVTHLEGICHSAGTYIFLSGDEFVVNPNSLLLFHNYSGGYYGKGNEVIAEVLASDVWTKQISDDIYYPFLTKEEIDSINSGEDRWMTSDEVIHRLDTVIAAREAALKEQTRISRLAIKEEIDSLVEQDLAELEEAKEAALELEKKNKELKIAEAESRLLKTQEELEKLRE